MIIPYNTDNTTSLPPKVIQEPSSTRTQINGNLPDFLRRLGQRKLIAIDWFPCDDRQLSSTWFVTYDNIAVLHDYFEAIKHPQLETWMVKTALWGDSCPGWIHWYSWCNIQFKDGASGAACRITAAFCLSLLIVADEMAQDSIVGSFATDINKNEQQRCQKISTKRRWQVARKLRLPEVSTIPGSIMDMSWVIIVIIVAVVVTVFTELQAVPWVWVLGGSPPPNAAGNASWSGCQMLSAPMCFHSMPRLSKKEKLIRCCFVFGHSNEAQSNTKPFTARIALPGLCCANAIRISLHTVHICQHAMHTALLCLIKIYLSDLCGWYINQMQKQKEITTTSLKSFLLYRP